MFLPAVYNTASVVGGIIGHSVRMLEQVQLPPDFQGLSDLGTYSGFRLGAGIGMGGEWGV